MRIFNLRSLRDGWHVAGLPQGVMFGNSDDYQPLGYMGRVPLYVTTLIVVILCGCMVTLALLSAAHMGGIEEWLVYDSFDTLRRWQFWRLLSYPLVNGPSIWFAVEMLFFHQFGREVERFIGRTAFAVMYVSLVAVSTCIFTALGTWGLFGLAGSWCASLGVFVAFATVYPDVEIFWTFKAKWIAAVIVGINILAMLAQQDLKDLVAIVSTCATGFLFIKYLRGHLRIPSIRDYFRRRRSRRNLRPLPRVEPPRREPPRAPDDVVESIDPLLDKIAKHGIGSLTPRERQKLEAARAALLKKEGH